MKYEVDENLLLISAETQTENFNLEKENRRLEDLTKDLNKKMSEAIGRLGREKLEAEKAFKKEKIKLEKKLSLLADKPFLIFPSQT